MAGLAAAVICLVIVSGLMFLRMRRLKKDIYEFSDQLEECLDSLVSGRKIPDRKLSGDGLWEKIYEKLQRLEGIQQKAHRETLQEKQQLKELISDISHQTKTPVANLKVYLEILQNETGAPGRSREFLVKMAGQLEKLDFLLQSLVKMSRLETGIIEIRQQPGRIYETLGRAVASVVPKAEKKEIRLYVECEEEILVRHDSKWTEEALFNILDNGVKYTPAGGSVRIKVTVQEIFTKISIKDTGKGIAPERQAAIFQRFYREPEVHDQEGIGVGAYLARKIITLQKGYIEVQSKVGQGAEFKIYLPNE